jgi:hypothetical protein
MRSLFPSLLVVALLSCCVTLALSSCSKQASVAIIGKWQVQGERDVIEFRKEGKVITSHDITAGPPGNTRVFKEATAGKYTFTEGNHMNLQMDTGGISIRCGVHIHGDQMDMTMTAPGDSQQHKVNFKRQEWRKNQPAIFPGRLLGFQLRAWDINFPAWLPLKLM